MSSGRYPAAALREGEEAVVIAQFQVIKFGMLWSTKKRILQVTTHGVCTLDPSNFKATNAIDYASITSLVSDESTDDQFTLTAAGNSYCFKTVFRTQLLCQLIESATKHCPQLLGLFVSHGPFDVQRMRKSKVKVEARLAPAAHGLVELDPSGKVLQQYAYVNITRYGSDEKANVFFFVHSDRIKLFVCSGLSRLLEAVKKQLKLLGLGKPVFYANQNANDAFDKRKEKVRALSSLYITFRNLL